MCYSAPADRCNQLPPHMRYSTATRVQTRSGAMDKPNKRREHSPINCDQLASYPKLIDAFAQIQTLRGSMYAYIYLEGM